MRSELRIDENRKKVIYPYLGILILLGVTTLTHWCDATSILLLKVTLR